MLWFMDFSVLNKIYSYEVFIRVHVYEKVRFGQPSNAVKLDDDGNFPQKSFASISQWRTKKISNIGNLFVLLRAQYPI